MPPSKTCQPKRVMPFVKNSAPIIIPMLYSTGARAKKANRPTACCMLENTVAIAKRNGLIAITRIMLTARARLDSSRPGPTTYVTSGSANIIMSTVVTTVTRARRLSKLVESSQADFLLPAARRWLNTGINVTLSAPDTRMKNMKSGIVKATV